MLRFNFLLLFIPIFLFLVARVGHSYEIHFSTSVPHEFQMKIEDDLRFLEGINETHCDEFSSARALCDSLGINVINGRTLMGYLNERVHYIVGESEKNFEFTVYPFLDSLDYEYPFRTIFPYEAPDLLFTAPTNGLLSQSSSDKEILTVMENVGGEVYLYGKFKYHQILTYPTIIERTGAKVDIPVFSPRVGILKIGKGLFDDYKGKIKQNSLSGLIFRLATFFHEARHSDGHGESLAFSHSYCPKGHDYEGHLSCDHSLNGSYQIDLVINQFFIEYFKGLGELSLEEESSLNLVVKDIESRIIRKIQIVNLSPENQKKIGEKEAELESLEDSLVNTKYDNLARAIIKKIERISKEIKSIKTNSSNPKTLILAKSWDEEPEWAEKIKK